MAGRARIIGRIHWHVMRTRGTLPFIVKIYYLPYKHEIMLKVVDAIYQIKAQNCMRSCLCYCIPVRTAHVVPKKISSPFLLSFFSSCLMKVDAIIASSLFRTLYFCASLRGKSADELFVAHKLFLRLPINFRIICH